MYILVQINNQFVMGKLLVIIIELNDPAIDVI